MTKTKYVYKEILNRINEFYWKPGDKINSERDLSILFKVSRVTIKSAIKELINDGYLEYKENKKGTFVKSTNILKEKEHLICVAIDNDTPSFSSFLLEGIHDSLLKKGYHTLYFNTQFTHFNILSQINSLITNKVGGVIFAPLLGTYNIENNKRIISLIEDNNIPLVQVDRFVDSKYSSYVGNNNKKGFYDLVNTIIFKGYKNIIIVNGYPSSSVLERIKGIKKSLKENNLNYNEIQIDESLYMDDKKISLDKEDIQKLKECDIAICVNQNLANIVSSIDSNIVLASISSSINESNSKFTIIQPMYEIGKESGRLIIDAIENSSASKNILISASIIEK